ncbi:hypothetical protein TNCV_1587161 [Trichonephila clavipes]|nr:hypothetical protein TNCV_1587161 [Trichonephila clavipes]
MASFFFLKNLFFCRKKQASPHLKQASLSDSELSFKFGVFSVELVRYARMMHANYPRRADKLKGSTAPPWDSIHARQIARKILHVTSYGAKREA